MIDYNPGVLKVYLEKRAALLKQNPIFYTNDRPNIFFDFFGKLVGEHLLNI